MTDVVLTTRSGARLTLERRRERAGGTANVHAALDPVGRRLAVKVARAPIETQLDREAELVEVLMRDPVAADRVVPVLDRGLWGDRPFLVLPWCEHTLASWAVGQPDPLARIRRARELCLAVDALHGRDPPILHGDLKPTNVMIDDTGAVRLTDFGAGRALPRGHTSTLGAVHTPRFSAPEAGVRPSRLDVRSDRWSLAATVVYAITGAFEPGPRGLSPPDRRRLRALVRSDPLERALDSMLAPRPDARMHDPRALAAALDHVRLASGASPVRSWAFVIALGAMSPVPPPQAPAVPTVPIPGTATGAPPFLAGTVEVSQGLWQAITGEDANAVRRIWDGGSVGAGCIDHQGVSLLGPELPVTCVGWLDAVAFANRLSEAHGLRPAYTVVVADPARPVVDWDRSSMGWRLPTAAEWRRLAGPTPPADESLCVQQNLADRTARQAFPAGDGEAPCDDGHAGPAPVDALAPGTMGVHHAFGNVAEWLWDERTPGTRRAVGASWSVWPAHGPVDGEGDLPPDHHGVALGVRLVRGVP